MFESAVGAAGGPELKCRKLNVPGLAWGRFWEQVNQEGGLEGALEGSGGGDPGLGLESGSRVRGDT